MPGAPIAATARRVAPSRWWAYSPPATWLRWVRRCGQGVPGPRPPSGDLLASSWEPTPPKAEERDAPPRAPRTCKPAPGTCKSSSCLREARRCVRGVVGFHPRPRALAVVPRRPTPPKAAERDALEPGWMQFAPLQVVTVGFELLKLINYYYTLAVGC